MILILGTDNDKMRIEARKIMGKGSELNLVGFPETSLHPSVHGDLFDTLFRNNPDALVLTHSEILPLRARRRVAEKTLSPGDVLIYWSDEKRYIKILPDGEIDWWPLNVFSDAYHEITAIRRTQQQTKKAETRSD